MKSFHLGDILTVTTGYLVSPTKDIYSVLNYMTGDDLFTHQLPRVARECAPYILAQHPELSAVDASVVTPDNWQAWLAEQVAIYGEMLALESLPANAHRHIGPVQEAEDLVGKDKVEIILINIDQTPTGFSEN